MKPVLYILMRNDLDSMNAGKGMAHAAHAANHFVHAMAHHALVTLYPNMDDLYLMYKEWKAQSGDQGFGTTIVLGGDIVSIKMSLHQIRNKVMKHNRKTTKKQEHFLSGITHDSSYPVRDGVETHLVPLDTCAWVFCNHEGVVPSFLKEYSLHP